MDGLGSLPVLPTTTIRSPPPTKRKPRTFHAGHRLGWARPSLPPAPSTTSPSRTTPSATFAATGHTGIPWTPSPPENLSRVYFGPRDCRRLASQLREWRRGHWRSSWIGSQAATRSLHRPLLAPPFNPSNPSSGLSLPKLPSLRRRCWKPWVHFPFWRHRHRRRRPTEPAPSSRRQLLWAFFPNYFSRRVAVDAADRAPFTVTDIDGAFNDQRLWLLRPYRPRKPHRHRFALGAPQHQPFRPTIALYRTIGLHQRSYHIFRG